MAKKLISLNIVHGIVITLFIGLIFLKINVNITLALIVFIYTIQIVNYIKNLRLYKKSQFYKLYDIPFSIIIKNHALYKMYYYYTALLMAYADHCELLVCLAPNKKNQKVPLLLLHKNGCFAFLFDSKSNKTVPCLEYIINSKIHTIILSKKMKIHTILATIENHITPQSPYSIHKYYDLLELNTKEYVL